jgi:hypothetical protein
MIITWGGFGLTARFAPQVVAILARKTRWVCGRATPRPRLVRVARDRTRDPRSMRMGPAIEDRWPRAHGAVDSGVPGVYFKLRIHSCAHL